VLLFLSNALSQTDIFTSFNSTLAGRNIAVTLSKKINNKYELGGGIRFNINRLALTDDQGNIYKKRLFATKPLHYFGLQGFYHRYVLNKWKHIKPFLFYDFQLTYSPTRNSTSLPFIYDVNENVLYNDFVSFGPFTWLEQTIDVGFNPT